MIHSIMCLACFWLAFGGHQNCAQNLDSIVVKNINTFIVELDSTFNINALQPIQREPIDTTASRTRRFKRG